MTKPTPDAGAGYRILDKSELLREGDEYYWDHDWMPTARPDRAQVGDDLIYRRKVDHRADLLPDAGWWPLKRKDYPLCSGVLDYFPDALLEVALVSKVGNEQHNPGEPLHWAKEKSTDEADALMRHLVERGKLDTDGMRHSAKVAWRALALLQRELDNERAK